MPRNEIVTVEDLINELKKFDPKKKVFFRYESVVVSEISWIETEEYDGEEVAMMHE